MISVVPTDVGKATSRLEKSKVQDGNCYWEKPLYETVKFSHDQKTGKIHEKIYYFIVAKVQIDLNLCKAYFYMFPNQER